MAKNLDDRIKQLETKDDQGKAGPVINTKISAVEWERTRSSFFDAFGIELSEFVTSLEASNG